MALGPVWQNDEYSQCSQMADVAIQSSDLLYCIMADQQEGKRSITFIYQ